jgi:hypothetical protein
MPPPVPLPSGLSRLAAPPDAAETELLSRGIITATAPADGLTELQHVLIAAVCDAMTGHPAVFDAASLDADGLALGLAQRDEAFRTRIVQVMALVAMVLRPVPSEVADRVEQYAAELGVDEGMLDVIERFASGSLGLAAIDFERNGYTAEWHPDDASWLHASNELADAWDEVLDDPALAARWADLEQLPPGTLGRRVTEFYRARGFSYPGLPGSAPPLLAQHDWVHVLADYGTTVESELEVFAMIARANDDPRAFSLLAMVVSLFETGYLRSGAGLFQASAGHLSESGVPERMADAMRRGALCEGSVDFLRVDWFELADLPVDEARGHFCVPAKSPGAVAAGSVGPWEPGGISPFQAAAGREAAARAGVPYEAFGARPPA